MNLKENNEKGAIIFAPFLFSPRILEVSIIFLE